MDRNPARDTITDGAVVLPAMRVDEVAAIIAII
jgi:hypothetical protein